MATCDEVIIRSLAEPPLRVGKSVQRGCPARRIKYLHLWQEHGDRSAALLERFKRMNAEPEFGEIEVATFAATHCGDDRIVEHAATIQIAGRDKERSGQPEFAQNRRCDLLVVCVAVVKSNRQRTRGKRTALQSRRRFGKRDHVEMPLHPAHSCFKFCGVGSPGSSGSGAASTL